MKKRPEWGGRRVNALLDLIARMAGGDLAARASISKRHDTIDALAFGLNLLGGELGHTMDGLRRAREEAERADAAKEIFLRNVTHELRTPITAIMLVGETLRRPTVSDQKRRELGERLERSARTLLRMVDHVLDLTRVEAQRLELRWEGVSPETLVREVVELLGLEAEKKALAVRVVVSRGAFPVVLTDATRLRQILINVVGNAVKYTEAGSVQVRLGRHGKLDLATFEVKDTGVGIDPEDQRALFEPFARGRTTAHRFPGNGLGLALSRRLAHALGGDLTLVRSTLGKGSTFRVTLPASKVNPGGR